MVITKIIGGLGNQMFQYAAGRALSLARGQSMRLDIAGFSGYGLHQGFELQRIFNCTVESAAESDVRSILGWQFLPGIKRLMARPGMEAFRRDAFVVEPYFHYWPAINQLPIDCYLAGYWQSEKYFKAYEDVIRDDFSFRIPFAHSNAELAGQIARSNAVSLHVRRGDYVSDPRTKATYGECTLDYYRDAIRHVTDRVDRPCFFIFSDDIDWVKDHFDLDMPCHYVEHNRGQASYNDMHLMSLCQHHIIANSSFSWWGAWLSRNPEKLVVAPRKWFANERNVDDLFPQGWVTL